VGEALIAGLLAGYGVAVPVGAIAVLILGLSARTSLAVGAGAGLGAATADGIYAAVAAIGGAAVAGLVRPVAVPLRWLAAVVLVGLAARTAVAAWRRRGAARPPDGDARPPHGAPGPPDSAARPPHGAAAQPAGRRRPATPGRAYLGLLALTLLNPATVIYFSALVLGRQAQFARSAGAAVVFVLAAFAASASWQLLVAAGGSAVGRILTGPRGQLVTALVSSGVIAVLAVALVV
jgi:arginine exporter protein ArgO